jgi:hypothetical protein
MGIHGHPLCPNTPQTKKSTAANSSTHCEMHVVLYCFIQVQGSMYLALNLIIDLSKFVDYTTNTLLLYVNENSGGLVASVV